MYVFVRGERELGHGPVGARTIAATLTQGGARCRLTVGAAACCGGAPWRRRRWTGVGESGGFFGGPGCRVALVAMR